MSSKEFNDVVHPTFRRNRDFLQGGFGINIKVTSREREDGEREFVGHRPDGSLVEESARQDEIECIRVCKDVLYNESRQGKV